MSRDEAQLLELVTFGHLVADWGDEQADSDDALVGTPQPEDLGGILETDSPDTVAATDEEMHTTEGGGEATDADIAEYQANIADLEAESLETFTMAEVDAWAAQVISQGAIFSNLIDSRAKLPRHFARGHGPGYRFPLSQKKGIVKHYAGLAQNRSLTALQRWQAYARAHIATNWGGGWRGNGIMYCLGAAENGGKHWLFDLNFARWHCGHAEANNLWIGVNNPFGKGQRPTKAQLRANFELASEWLAFKRLPRTFCRGHNYFSATECPGAMTNDFIKPFHRGASFGNGGGGSAPTPPSEQDRLLRVQSYAFSEDEERRARDTVATMKERGLPTALIFEEPHWKISHGAFELRAGAEQRRDEVHAKGFPAVLIAVDPPVDDKEPINEGPKKPGGDSGRRTFGDTLLGSRDTKQPPPALGTRFGDPSNIQLGGIHRGWDVWVVEGEDLVAVLPGRVISSRDRHTVSEAWNMAIIVEYDLPRGEKLYMQVLHMKQGTMLANGTEFEAGRKLGECGYFKKMGHPHFHIEFFWNRQDALMYRHAKSVDPYHIRKNHLPEIMPITRVAERYHHWWKDRPGVLPSHEEAPIRGASASAFSVEDEEVSVACAHGEPLPDAL